MHLVIGAGEFLARHVTRALAADVPVIELAADADGETLDDAITGVEVVIFAAQTAAPGGRVRYRRKVAGSLEQALHAAQRARVRRLVHVSTADVFGPAHATRLTERSPLKPAHAYAKTKLYEEEWLLANAGEVEVVIVRPARVFGSGEGWITPHLMSSAVKGRVWLPGGGRARQTFVYGEDVGRACLAASDRGRPGHRYIVGGFDSTWRDFIVSASRAVGFAADVGSLPYDLAYIRALGVEAVSPPGRAAWPGSDAVDIIGKSRCYDDSYSRRELTWSPSVGSFEQEMPAMAPWLLRLPEVAAALVEAPVATSQPGR